MADYSPTDKKYTLDERERETAYPSNARKDRQSEDIPKEKKLDPVISGGAKLKKKSKATKAAESFLSDDVQNVKSYILSDVLLPAIKKLIFDIITNGVEMSLYGETGMRSDRRRNGASKVSYSKYYDDPRDRRRDDRSRGAIRARGAFDYDELVFDSRGAAEAVLTAMDEAVDMYGVVSVGDLYDLAEVTTNNYMVHEYGWTNIRSASVIRVRDGYIIKMPKVEPLN